MVLKTSLATMAVCYLSFSLAQGAIGDWHNYTYSDDSKDIVFDGDYIWCATSGGLLRHDVTTGEIRKYLNSDGVGDINLLSLEVDTAGALFVGGSNGTISKIPPGGTIAIYDFEYTTEIRYNIFDMSADGDVLWVATDIGVGKFLIYHNGGEFQDIIAQLGDIPSETVVRAVRVVGDYVWAGTDLGLAYLDKYSSLPQNPQNWTTFTVGENGLTDARIRSIAAIGDTVFIGTPTGVFMFGADSMWSYVGPASTTIYALQNLSAGLAAATGSGVYLRSGGIWQLLPTDSLKTTAARGVSEDGSGSIWASFSKGGFARFSDGQWEVFTVPGPPTNNIVDIALDSSGTVWLAHDAAGLTRFDGTTWTSYDHTNSGLGSSGVFAIVYDRVYDYLWLASWGDGLFQFDRDSLWINYDETNSPLIGVEGAPWYIAMTDVAVDNRGTVWGLTLVAANPDLVMAGFNPGDSTWQTYIENPDQVPDNSQLALLVDGHDVYVGGSNVYRLDYGVSLGDTADDQWYGPLVITGRYEIEALALDRYGKLFAGGLFGLAYYDSLYDDTVMIDLPDGYRSTIFSMTLDGLGNKWIGTDSGVVVLASEVIPGQPNWLAGLKTSNSFLLHNSIRSIEIDKKAGLVYIATINGLSVYESGFAAPSPDLSDMAVFPNPVNAQSDNAHISFLRVPADAEISIYNAAGELVRRFNYAQTNTWNLRNEDSKEVSGGVYFFHVRSGEMSGSGKFAVIR